MKHIYLSVLLVFAATYGFACSVCGCTAGNQYLGILPQYGEHFIGLQYQYRSFTSEHPDEGENGGSAFSDEDYHTIQLWGKVNIGKRLKLMAFVPYIVNAASENGITSRIHGLGDITILGNIQAIDKDNGKGWRHNLQAGGGIKLPTGYYDAIAIEDAGGLPNMQPGTGSWDVIANANYTVRFKQSGINMDAAYTIATPNRYKYKYGNRLSAGLLGFYWWKKNNLNILPQAGCRLDVSGADYDDYISGSTSDMTGGSQLYVTAGVQVYFKRVGVQLSAYKPVAQHYANGLVKNKFKTEAGLYLLF